jgi:YidC/Oxa1 family membrane protein insertase
MDFQRVFLFLIFSFSLFLLWDGWQREQQPVPQIVSAASTPVASQSLASLAKPVSPELVVSAQKTAQTGERISVKTDFFRAEINTAGGDIRRIELLQHFDTVDKSKPFVLFQQEEGHTYIANQAY